jgi:hypothetical protein
MRHLDRLRVLEDEVERYETEFATELEHERNEEFRLHVLKVAPGLVGLVSVWCRNSDVCRVATHCETLTCPFKSSPDAVVDGISRCRRFQITSLSETWGPAKHIAAPSSVDIGYDAGR